MVSQNNINNTVVNNNFSVNKTTASSTCVASVNHSDNSSTTSHAEILVQSGGTSGGDSFFRASVSGVQSYSFGIDNSDSDNLKITTGSTPSAGTTLWNMAASGILSSPLQPVFSAYLATADSNITGNGTAATLGSGTALTEIKDTGGDFNTNGTFTAPVSGRYYLCGIISISSLSGGTDYICDIVSSNWTYEFDDCDAVAQIGTSSSYSTQGTFLVDMDSGDTATIQCTLTGVGADTTDFRAPVGGIITNAYSGCLAC